MYEGKRVILAAFEKKYLEKALEYINDYDTSSYLITGIPFPLRIDDEMKFYENNDPFSNGKYNFAILRKSDREYIGNCGINEVDWKNSFCTVGIFLGKPFWNKGYGTDAMKTLVNFIFNELSLNKIRLFVFEFNQRAIKSYEKCGFTVEGRFRKQLFRNGKFHDVYAMGILREEWQAK
jgi:RimJ/RimL family protein N-acetyltransferase